MEISENRSKQVILFTNGEMSVRLRGFFHSQRFWCKISMHILATKSLGSFEKHPIIEIWKVTTIHWSHPVPKNHLLACKLTQQLYHIVYIIVVIPGLVNCHSLRTGKIHHAMKMAKSTTFRLGHFQVRKLIITPFQRILVSIPRTCRLNVSHGFRNGVRHCWTKSGPRHMFLIKIFTWADQGIPSGRPKRDGIQ